ncbi:MAG: Bacterial antitoxin of ParD toxin-antitoxin type system [Verrucomicrobiota bacterium]
MTITLPRAWEQLIEDKILSGLYADESEVVCEALRHEFEQDAVSRWVQKQAAVGLPS